MLIKRVVAAVKAYYDREPVRVLTAAATAIVAGAALAGIVVDQQAVLNVLVFVMPILLGGEITRRKVVPYVPDEAPLADGYDPEVAR